MISKIPVKLKDNAYDLFIGYQILDQLPQLIKDLGLGKDALIITHPMIEDLYGKSLTVGLKNIPSRF